MFGSRDMASARRTLLHLAALNIVVSCVAGPLGPPPNVTSSAMDFKEGTCSLGDVVYMQGDEFTGSSPCERCTCSERGVQCARQECEPRPGCKALHRPDHCCPTYQCECEQEGRVYGNGEKLVDPADPCRVCYCQGGEVVCRRIACFVRDDCTPRLVPGRCCPEYDNCPLRGVTALPGVSSSMASIPTIESVGSLPVLPKENYKQNITIKEITPVSEIPVITDVKIKEILPSSSFEVAEYVSSKSPLIPREATSEKNIKVVDSRTDTPIIIEVHSASPIIVPSPVATKPAITEVKETDATPSKISFSTQDSINSDIYPSIVPIVATMGIPPVTAEPMPIATTKAPIMEEEDTFDHNPAFPPLPDDLAVLRNHEDEIVPEIVVDNEHVPSHDNAVTSMSPSTQTEIKELSITTLKVLRDMTTVTITEKPKTTTELTNVKEENMAITESVVLKESPMLNLRSAIPTEILNVPSSISEEITGELDETTTTTDDSAVVASSTIITVPKLSEESSTVKSELSIEQKGPSETSVDSTTIAAEIQAFFTESKPTGFQEIMESSPKKQEQTTSSIDKSNIATDVTSQTELSSLPVETSDQNPPEVSTKDEAVLLTPDTLHTNSKPVSSEIITVGQASLDETTGFENAETTEFVLTSFGSAETATDQVEIIKISADPDISAAIIESPDSKKNNVLTDLIKLVSDVASMSDHTEEPEITKRIVTTIAPSISDSEELIPVNAGFKSKNKNFNQNSITEIPLKTKQSVKQKIVEIEDDESESVTDSPPPNDKVEPTTRRPIIDNVSDGNVPENKTETKDIEIITQSYVPTINKRPTKVIMKVPISEEAALEDAPAPVSPDSITEGSPFSEIGQTTGGNINFSSEVEGPGLEAVNATLSSTQ